MGSKIPEEPSYLIFNTAISSTWAFPYNVPDWCPKCYDCDNPKCACSFNPGFCNMMKTGKVAMKIDSVRVYQSKDDNAHDGKPHTLGCDPLGFPTREFIKGYEYRYMRSAPFGYDDKHPLRDVKQGGGNCVVDEDCGGGGSETEDVDQDWEQPFWEAEKDDNGPVMDLDDDTSSKSTSKSMNDDDGTAKKTSKKTRARRNLQNNIDTKTLTDDASSSTLDVPPVSSEALEDNAGSTKVFSNPNRKPKGVCVVASPGLFGTPSGNKQCKCNEGYTGPHCLAVEKYDEEPGAQELRTTLSKLLDNRATPYLTRFHVFLGGIFVGAFLIFLAVDSMAKSRKTRELNSGGREMVNLVNQS